MDSLRRIEDDVRNLGIEAKKKYPAIKEATEKSFQTLKQMREGYVAEVMRKDVNVSKFRSTDVTAPYYMVLSQTEAPIKLLTMALGGIQLFLDLDCIPPTEAAQVTRIFTLQINGKPELQLKVLQMTLQFANLLARDASSSQYLTDSILRDLLAIPLQLCDGKGTVAVSHTAFATSHQIIALVMNGVCDIFQYPSSPPVSSASYTRLIDTSPEQASSSLVISAQMLLKDLSILAVGKTGLWMRGITVLQITALDLLYDILLNWRHLFQSIPIFISALKISVCPAMNALLKRIQTDYNASAATMSSSNNPSSASAAANAGGGITSRVVKISRFLLHNFIQRELLDELDLIIALMAQSFQPAETDLDNNTSSSSFDDRSSIDKMLSRLNIPLSTSQILKPLPLALPSRTSSASMEMGNNNSNGSNSNGMNNTMLALNRHGGNTSGGVAAVHAHPVGACLEAILSFLLIDNIVDTFVSIDGGAVTLASIFTVCLSSASIILSESLSIDSSITNFELFYKDSPLVAVLERVLSGEEADADHAMRQIHDMLGLGGAGGLATIGANEVVLLSFQILVMTTRLLTQHAIQVALFSRTRTVSPGGIDSQSSFRYCLSPELLPPLETLHQIHPFLCKAGHEDGSLRMFLSQVCDRCYETSMHACVTILLAGIQQTGLIRRSLGVLSELALSTGLLHLPRACEMCLSTLCKFTVPKWGSIEVNSPLSPKSSLPPPPRDHPSTSSSSSSHALKWRHVQAFVRLVQVVHVLADAITDWDAIMDCFEQLTLYIRTHMGSRRIEVTPDEVDKVLEAIQRFKYYTVHIADDTLVKLMTSLVALSLNTLAVFSSSQYASYNKLSTTTSSGNIEGDGSGGAVVRNNSNTTLMSNNSLAAAMSMGVANSRTNPTTSTSNQLNYMSEGIASGLIGFSMQAAVEIIKINSFRVSSVWQMVMSHLRMVASLKSSTLRVVSVAATHDVIASTLEFLLSKGDTSVTLSPEFHPFMLSTCRLTDDILYALVMPQFEVVFDALNYQKIQFDSRLKALSDNWPKLTQLDLFSSLKSLSSVRYDDVRKSVLFGLRSLLQGKGGGQIKGVGWVTIIELLILVPSSMRGDSSSSANTSTTSPLAEEGGEDEESSSEQWPRATLETAFNCMTLIVDDFLDQLPDYAIFQGICCLASFGSQVIDVNISLTAVELLWKVTDHALSSHPSTDQSSSIPTTGRDEATFFTGEAATVSKVDLLNLTMTHLQSLSKDQRPEIRNCAMRTLFAAIVANSSLLSVESWRFVFHDILFPLFDATLERSDRASHETSDAPELKKGVKMTMHHSRDTASKQWAETISLELKGFARVLKSCTRILLEEEWFFATWAAAIDIFVTAARTPSPSSLTDAYSAASYAEVSIAGLDSLFNLLRTASPSSLGSCSISTLNPHDQKSGSSQHTQTLSNKHKPRAGGILSSASISFKGNKSNTKGDLRSNKMKDMLWYSVWKAVDDLAHYDGNAHEEYALKFLQMLLDYYNLEKSPPASLSLEASVFQDHSILRTLLDTIVLLSRPRAKVSAKKTAELQTIRGVVALLKTITPTSVAGYIDLVSAVAEISFSITSTTIQCPLKKTDIVLFPCPPSLRSECIKYLKSLISFESITEELLPAKKYIADYVLYISYEVDLPPGFDAIKLLCLDVISRRFLIDICQNLLRIRSISISCQKASSSNNTNKTSLSRSSSNDHTIESPRRRSSSQNKPRSFSAVGSFFSAVGNILTQSVDETESSSENLLNEPELSDLVTLNRPLHILSPLYSSSFSPHSSPSSSEEYGIFHASSEELDLLHVAAVALLNSKAFGENGEWTLKPVVWSTLLLSLLCTGSPWSAAEVIGEGRDNAFFSVMTEVDDGESEAIIGCIQRICTDLTSFALHDKFPTTALLALTETLITLCRVIIHRAHAIKLASHSKILFASLHVFFQGLVSIFRSQFSKSNVKERALSGILCITNGLTEALFHDSDGSKREYLRRGLESMLLMVRDSESSIDALPTEDSHLEDPLLVSWPSCCALIDKVSRDNWSSEVMGKGTAKASNSSSSQATLHISRNPHLLLLFPLALRILNEECAGGFVDANLRAAAFHVLSSGQPSTLIGALRTVDARVNKLELDRRTKEELSYLNV